jgi:stage III sporulation protein SpoIIIAA
VRERAIRTFSEIEGLDDIKEMLLRAIESQERAHTLVIGPPACAKSLFMLEIERILSFKRVYFAEGDLQLKLGYKNSLGKISVKRLS